MVPLSTQVTVPHGRVYESPWDEVSYRYFTPNADDTPIVMVRRLADLNPELYGMGVERARDGRPMLRGGGGRVPLQSASVEDLVRAVNALLEWGRVAERYVELRWPGKGRAYAMLSIREAVELLHAHELVVHDQASLRERAVW